MPFLTPAYVRSINKGMANKPLPKKKCHIKRQKKCQAAIKNAGKKAAKTAALSITISLISVCIGAVYSQAISGRIYAAYLINTMFIVGAIVLAAAFAMYAAPAKIGAEGLVDHSNYAELIMEARDKKRLRSYGIMVVGFGVFLIAGVAELLLL